MAFGSFSSMFLALCLSSGVPVYLTSELLGFASCLHALGIHLPRLQVNSFQEKRQQYSRTCYCLNFSNEHSQHTSNPLLFSFKSIQKFSRQNLPVRKKSVYVLPSPKVRSMSAPLKSMSSRMSPRASHRRHQLATSELRKGLGPSVKN